MNILQEIKVPQESVNDTLLNVVDIKFRNNDKVIKNDLLLELETSKAIITIESDYNGYVEYLCNLGDEVPVNKIIIKIWDQPFEIHNEPPNKVDVNQIEANNADSQNKQILETIFSKAALELLEKNKIDKYVFKEFDFVSKKNILNFLNPNLEKNESNITSNTNINSKSDELLMNDTRVKFIKTSHSKKREIEYLSDVQSGGLVSVINIDLDIENLFESTNTSFQYFKNSALPIIIFECSRLLKKYPMFNSFYSENGVAEYNDVNIGIAMHQDDGLKVVKIPNTNNLQLIETEEMLFSLACKYLDKKLTTFDLSDITFTITDLSSFGPISFTPLINRQNSAILGISKIDEKLQRIILSLAFDHRITEGKIASLFLQELKQRFESYKLSNDSNIKTKIVYCYKCLKTLQEDLNNIGFLQVIKQNGENAYICDMCLLKY